MPSRWRPGRQRESGNSAIRLAKATARLFVLIGTAVGLVLFTGLTLLPRLVGLLSIPPQVAVASLTVLPVGYLYAVRRHRLLGLPSIWDRWLVRTVGASVLALGYLVILGVILDRLGQSADQATILARTAVVFALGLSAAPLARAAAFTMDRVLFHDAYSHHDAIRSLVDAIGAATDVPQAFTQALRDVRTWLDLLWLALLVDDRNGWRVQALASTLPHDAQTDLAAKLAQYGASQQPEAVLRPLVAASFPVALGTGRDALLLAGPKANGEPLRRGDRDVLAALAAMLGAPLARGQLLTALQDRVDELEHHKATLQRLGSRLRGAHEEERTRISTRLHDGPLQLLHGLLRALDAGQPLDELRTLATEAAEELRGVCWTLRPPVLDELGLPAALNSLARRLEHRAGCPIAVIVERYEARRPHPDAELALYRIAQEALANCARHADAKTITVLLQGEEGTIHLDVCDDGRGFDVDAARRAAKQVTEACIPERLGLVEMHEYANTLGGTVTIFAAPGQGTQVRAVLPLVRIERRAATRR